MTWRGANRHQTGLAGRRTGAAGGTVGRELLLVGWRQSLSMMRHRRGPPCAPFGFAAIRGLTVLLRMTSQGQPEPQRADSAVVAHGNAWMPIRGLPLT